jgi:hypothetical protein
MEKCRIAAVHVRQSYIVSHTPVEHNMKMKVEIKSKFKVNGKEYSSPEEKPENIRNAYEKALANAARRDSASPGAPTTRIVFYGQE